MMENNNIKKKPPYRIDDLNIYLSAQRRALSAGLDAKSAIACGHAAVAKSSAVEAAIPSVPDPASADVYSPTEVVVCSASSFVMLPLIARRPPTVQGQPLVPKTLADYS